MAPLTPQSEALTTRLLRLAKPGGRLPLLSARPAVTPATLKRPAIPVSLVGEQRHDGCEQFA